MRLLKHTPSGPIRKILAIKMRSLGDTVLMTAPLMELKRSFPQAEIHAAALSAWAPLLENHPAVDRLWTYDRRPEKAARAKALARLAFQLRGEHFDCVLCFHASPSSSILAFATGAKIRSIHFHGHTDKNRYSTLEIPGKGILKPIIERDMDTVRALGISIPEGKLPELFPSLAEKQETLNLLSRLGFEKPVLIIGLGASRPTKSWPIERFARVAVDWVIKKKGSVMALAAPHEQGLSREFLKSVDNEVNASIPEAKNRALIRKAICTQNQMSIREIAALMTHAQIFLGNDSGPKHLAVAVGTPTVTLFGPEHPLEWHPYSKNLHPYFFIENLECRRDGLPGYPPWCGLDVCKIEEHKCMRMIGTDHVFSECEKVARK